jgi:hypothetical protein
LREIVPEDVDISKKRSKKLWILIVSIVIIVVVVLATVLYLVVLRPASPLRILSVSISPENPTSSDRVTIVAHVEGGSSLFGPSVNIHHGAYFGDGGSGGGSMIPIGNNRYQSQMRRTIADGTEVWFIVAASTNTEGPIFSENYTFQVGEVIRDGPSDLTIEDVTQSPQEPTSLDTVVVTARIVSKSNITEVRLIDMRFFRFGGGGGSGGMQLESTDNYTGEITAHGPGGGGFERGTIHFYRVVAIDETGNTAVSEVYWFTVV